MMREVMLGMSILAKYLPIGEYAHFAAEHDEIWCDGPAPNVLSNEEIVELDRLGFHWDSDNDSWHRFV